MRRVIFAAALAAVAVLGFGAALGLTGSEAGTPGSQHIPICQSGNGKNFTANAPDASSIVSGGHGVGKYDVVPAFVLTETDKNGKTTTTSYPGQNVDTRFTNGLTGAELLALGCREPSGPVSDHTVTEKIIEPPSKITAPDKTTTETIMETIVVPPLTETAPETTTVVTVPAGSEAIVTLPERVVTLPPATETTNGETVVHPVETVTLPGTVETVTGAAASTVVTVTGPDKVVEDGTTATTHAAVTVTAPREVTTEPAHTITLDKHKHKGETVAETVEKKLAVPAKNVTLPGTRTSETIGVTFTEPAPIEMPPGTSTVVTVEGGGSVSKRTVVTVTTPSRVVHEATRVLQVEEEVVIMVVVHHCPAGTAFYNGICAHIARGKG